jgi:hypothetical protein
LNSEVAGSNRGHSGVRLGHNGSNGVNCDALFSLLNTANAELRASPELDTEVEAASRRWSDDCQRDHHKGDDVEDLTTTDKVNRPVAAVKIVSEIAKFGH